MKSNMRLIKSALEYRSIKDIRLVPPGMRGIYSLYKKTGKNYNMVYIGMSGKGGSGRIRSRLARHSKNVRKNWTHFSYYEVWDNVSDSEIQELEGLFRQLYRFDSRANALNLQQTHKPLTKVRRDTEKELGLQHITKQTLGVS